MKTNKLVLTFILCIAFAAEAKEPIHGLGFAGGQQSGLGLSYRKLGENLGFQVTFGALSLNRDDLEDPYYPMDDGTYSWQPTSEVFSQKQYTRGTDANIGLLLIKVLHSANRSRFYSFIGGSAFFSIDTFEESTYEYRLENGEYYTLHKLSEPKKKSETTSTIFAGVGIGIEFQLTQNIRIAVEWPLTYSTDGDFIMYIPEAALHYFF